MIIFLKYAKKASEQLTVLKRIGIFFFNHRKLTNLKSFIVSYFNYCPLSWQFCSQAGDQKKWGKYKKEP